MISTHLFLLLVLPATLGVELPYMRCFLLPPSKYMIFVVDVWFPLYFPSLIWKRAIFEVFARGIFYSLLCMFQYQASRQPWWTVSFWFWSRPSGWCLQTWDVLNIWYDNFIYDNYYFFCKISRKKQVFFTSDMFFCTIYRALESMFSSRTCKLTHWSRREALTCSSTWQTTR